MEKLEMVRYVEPRQNENPAGIVVSRENLLAKIRELPRALGARKVATFHQLNGNLDSRDQDVYLTDNGVVSINHVGDRNYIELYSTTLDGLARLSREVGLPISQEHLLHSN